MTGSSKIYSFSKQLDDMEDLLNNENVTIKNAPEVDTYQNTLAFCPLIERNCLEVDCGRCYTLTQEYEGYFWACPTCMTEYASDLILLPFWHDGTCDCCTREDVFILGMVKPRPVAQDLPETLDSDSEQRSLDLSDHPSSN